MPDDKSDLKSKTTEELHATLKEFARKLETEWQKQGAAQIFRQVSPFVSRALKQWQQTDVLCAATDEGPQTLQEAAQLFLDIFDPDEEFSRGRIALVAGVTMEELRQLQDLAEEIVGAKQPHHPAPPKTDPKSAAVLQAQAVMSMSIDILSVIQATLLDQKERLLEAAATSEVVGMLGGTSCTVEGWLAGGIELVNESLEEVMSELAPPENGWRSHLEEAIASAAEAGDEVQGGSTSLLEFRRNRPEDN